MPSQTKMRSKPGSNRGSAIIIDLASCEDSQVPTSNTRRTARSSRQSRTKAASLTKPAGKPVNSKSKATTPKAKTPLQDISSDSDESSDAPVVATSRTDKGKQRSTEGGGQTSFKRRQADVKTSEREHSAMQLDPQASPPIARLPTPESLVAEESEAEPKRLLKADRTPVKKATLDNSNTARIATSGPSFTERLHSNATPRFSKTFRGKARSSVSTSHVRLKDSSYTYTD